MNKLSYTVNRVSRKNIRSITTRPQEGQSLVEYSLLLGLLAVAVIGIINVLGTQVNNSFSSATNSFSSMGGIPIPNTVGITVQAQAAATATPASSSGNGSGSNGGSGGGGTSPTATPAPTATTAPTATPVPTATPTATAAPTATVAPTATTAPTATPVPTTVPATTVPPTATAKPTATAAPTATTAPTATPIPPTATLTPTPFPATATPTATAVASGQYSVAYNKTNQWYTWNNGTPVSTSYEVNVVITNKSSSSVNGWAISWKLDNNETFYNYWNANCAIAGSMITCTNPSGYNTVMSPGGTVSFYVQLNSANMNITTPKSYTVNGTTVAA